MCGLSHLMSCRIDPVSASLTGGLSFLSVSLPLVSLAAFLAISSRSSLVSKPPSALPAGAAAAAGLPAAGLPVLSPRGPGRGPAERGHSPRPQPGQCPPWRSNDRQRSSGGDDWCATCEYPSAPSLQGAIRNTKWSCVVSGGLPRPHQAGWGFGDTCVVHRRGRRGVNPSGVLRSAIWPRSLCRSGETFRSTLGIA